MNKIYKIVSVLATVCILTVSSFPLHVYPSENSKKVFINESCTDRLLNTMRISTLGDVETYCRNYSSGDYAVSLKKKKAVSRRLSLCLNLIVKISLFWNQMCFCAAAVRAQRICFCSIHPTVYTRVVLC